jgi:hypothetical protein
MRQPTIASSEVAAGVDAPRMMARLQRLGQLQKYPGTADERTSLETLQVDLAEMGFHTRVLEHDAYISLPRAAAVHVGGQSLTAITHSFSQSSGPDGIRAEAVYVGRGTPAEMAGRDLRGRVLVMDHIATPSAAIAATRAGAIGQVHVSPHEYLHEMCISPVWGSPSEQTREQLPRTVVCTVSRKDGDMLKAALREGTVTLTLNAEVDTGWRKTPILEAELAPDDAGPDAPFVLFSGHHDTWYYGLMDNGTANIAMLEVARLCAQRRSSWRRGLRLCFWSGHSHGRYSGSSWYVDHHWSTLKRRCVAHVNIDSTGGAGSTLLENAQSMGVLRDLAQDAIWAESQQRIKGDRMARAGDQSLESLGTPAMFMGVGQQEDVQEERVGPDGTHLVNRRVPNALGWWWHTPHDTIEHIDPELQARDTRIYVHVITSLLESPLLPLNVQRALADLKGFLQPMFQSLRERGIATDELQLCLDEACALAGRLEECRKSPVPPAPRAAERVNAAVLAACQALVPLEYVAGDRFSHDAALPQPPFPSLQTLQALCRCDASSDEARYLAVSAVRARNRVLDGLHRAGESLAAALAAAALPDLHRI